MKTPFVTIILPTYNNEKTIRECLESIRMQNYKDYEILLIDGGSDDRTIDIAKEFKCKILKNPDKIEESARILGIKKSLGNILCFIDADNILVGKDWVKKMLEPFEDEEIIFVDTLYYSYKKTDKIGVRYQALIGGDDPIVAYLGFYSRWNYFKKDWTDYPYIKQDKGNYLKIKLKNKEKVPAMGSNGFLVRTKIIRKFVKDNFIHSDFIYNLINSKYNCFAKVKIGIVHNQPKFFQNKIRRMKRRKQGIKIRYNYGLGKLNFLIVGLYIGLIFPVLFDSLRGFIRKRDSAWLFHLPASLILLSLYIYYSLK